MRTVQVGKSILTAPIGTESGPGLISPVTFLPSQFITNVIGLRCFALVPQSPVQVPVRGWPSWAKSEIAAPRQMIHNPSFPIESPRSSEMSVAYHRCLLGANRYTSYVGRP